MIKEKIRTIPDFPKKGIMFRDVTTLFKDKDGFKETVNRLHERYKNKGITKVVGIESRGFIIGGALAYLLNAGFVPARKPGKLPGDKIKVEYSLEYGKDALEMHKDAISEGDKVLIVDDLIATAGTMKATTDLVNQLKGHIVGCALIVELPDLKGREKLKDHDIFSLVQFEGD